MLHGVLWRIVGKFNRDIEIAIVSMIASYTAAKNVDAFDG